jgi:hypothetical protein
VSLVPIHLPLGDGDKAQLVAAQASVSLMIMKPSLPTPDPAATAKKAGDAYVEDQAIFPGIKSRAAANSARTTGSVLKTLFLEPQGPNAITTKKAAEAYGDQSATQQWQ